MSFIYIFVTGLARTSRTRVASIIIIIIIMMRLSVLVAMNELLLGFGCRHHVDRVHDFVRDTRYFLSACRPRSVTIRVVVIRAGIASNAG